MRDIKDMQLYPSPERILRDLTAVGFPAEATVEAVAALDQLHYHGSSAVDVAISRLGIRDDDAVLEIGSGWGGPARWIAHRTGARVEAVELQDDYDAVARELTERTGLAGQLTHTNGDFLTVPLAAAYDHIVSWLALYHIPDRARYLGRMQSSLRPGGQVWIEDLALNRDIPDAEYADFARAMFPNSIVPLTTYGEDLAAAGFEAVEVEDMTDDWSAFVDDRLTTFRANREAYEARHGPDGYAALDNFYSAVAGYFAKGILGGVRVQAQKPVR